MGDFIKQLTGVRFVAAAWVMLYHFQPALAASGVLVPILHEFLRLGSVGVDLFFALSGFILTHTYLTRLGPKTSWSGSLNFWWLRLARIYPVYFVMLNVAGLAALAQGIVTGEGRRDWMTLPSYLKQVLMIQEWGPDPSRGWNFPAWSLSMEWLAYLFFPLLVLVLWRAKDRPAPGGAGRHRLPEPDSAAVHRVHPRQRPVPGPGLGQHDPYRHGVHRGQFHVPGGTQVAAQCRGEEGITRPGLAAAHPDRGDRRGHGQHPRPAVGGPARRSTPRVRGDHPAAGAVARRFGPEQWRSVTVPEHPRTGPRRVHLLLAVPDPHRLVRAVARGHAGHRDRERTHLPAQHDLPDRLHGRIWPTSCGDLVEEPAREWMRSKAGARKVPTEEAGEQAR